MKFQDLRRSFNDGALPVYLVEGDDAFLRERAVKLIKDKFMTQPEFNYSVFEGSFVKEKQDEVVSALKSFPFMSPKRVVVLRDYYPTAIEVKNGKGVISCINSPEEEIILIIVNSEKSDSLKKLPKVTLVDCNKGDADLVAVWVKSRALKAQLGLCVGVIEKLCDYCQCDMTRISGEMEKLVCYCHGKDKITVEDVEAIVTKDTDYRIYEAVEYIAKGLFEKAYETLFDLLDKNTDKQRLFVSIYMHFRRLLFVSITSYTPSKTAEMLGVKEYAIKKAKEQARSFSPVKLKDIVKRLTEYDADFKSGKIALDDALWNSVFKIMVEASR